MMNRDRAERIWQLISNTERIALTRGLNDTFPADLWKTEWKNMKEHHKEALLRLDWEVMLGKRFSVK